jgi:exodeoxyribonuclease V alpha subunit
VYVATLTPKKDKKYGMGYEVVTIYEEMPSDVESQYEFLSAILTPNQLTAIYEVYPNQDVIELIKNDTFDYEKVKGMGKVTYEKLREKILSNIEHQQAISELHKYGLTTKMIIKISEHYGSPTLLVEKVKNNPYILADEVKGIGFKKADKIALSMGVEADSPNRLEACFKFVLSQEENEGNVWVSRKDMIEQVSSLTNVNGTYINTTLTDVLNTSDWMDEYLNGRLALTRNFDYENGITQHVKRILSVEGNFHVVNPDIKITASEESQGYPFTSEQLEGIRTAIAKNFMIINGKAGTGKTSVLKGVLGVLEGFPYMTCALSGKASNRIKEGAGLDSMTIHRMLGWTGEADDIPKNEDNPMDYDIIVLDEASMVNSQILYHLVCAVKDGAKVILLGDTEQLEPIGAGNCLRDLINSGVVPVITLIQVHRQAMRSGILSSANLIRDGKLFYKQGNYASQTIGELQDLFFYPFDNSDSVHDTVLNICRKYKGNVMDFQVIVPMKQRGKIATEILNGELQEIFNPINEYIGNEIKFGRKSFRTGDKVIVQGNNYDKGLFNGTIGIVDWIANDGTYMNIDFEGVGIRQYNKDELSTLDLAYALTVHKTQGSQFKHVLIAVDWGSFKLLSRQLIYTGITRSEKSCILTCELEALTKSIRTDKSSKRNTFLVDLLKEAM